MSGYSIFTESKSNKKDMEIQEDIDGTIAELEAKYGIVIQLDYWDYVEEEE